MTAVTYLTRHRRPGIVILCAIVAVLWMLFVLPPAIASAADSGAQAVDECNPTASNGCVNGILQDADKKPIADVTITLSGKATAETKTAADGKWAFSVADDGDYTVIALHHDLPQNLFNVLARRQRCLRQFSRPEPLVDIRAADVHAVGILSISAQNPQGNDMNMVLRRQRR